MEFFRAEPTAVTSWRMAVLMGANSRTYKFALGSALLSMAREGREAVTLDELAMPYAISLVEHAERYPQAPPVAVRGASDFLTVLKDEAAATRAAGQPTQRLVEAAVASMPSMVMQKFHNLRGVGEVNHTFYRVERSGSGRLVVLTRELIAVAQHAQLLREELASRWTIVEACFDAGLGRSLVESGVVLSPNGEELLTWRRRAPVTKARAALVGFQHGRCFYCHEPLSTIVSRSVHVDHVYPVSLMTTGSWTGPDLNGVWNLVVTCAECNLTKSNRTPTEAEVRNLRTRNEAIIRSPHPLPKTLELSMRAPGEAPALSEAARLSFLQAVDLLATDRGLAAS